MTVPGPPPKPGAARRNQPTYVTKSLPAEGRKGEAPAPVLPPDCVLVPQAVEWWETLWSSPMAAAYDVKADLAPLSRLLWLTNEWLTEGFAAPLAAEMRQIEDRYGLNPTARQKLRWEVAADDAASGGGGRKAPRKSEAGGADDPRNLLRVV